MVMQMTGNKRDKVFGLFRYFPDKLNSALKNIREDVVNELCEIRLRSDNAIVLVFADGASFITESGRLSRFKSVDCICLNDTEVSAVFSKMCNYSVYSYTDSICGGFITLDSGVRVGVYGSAVICDGNISAVRNIRGMNIRIPGNYNGISSEIADKFSQGCYNVLICGPPSSGKTTVLKDLCRTLSDIYSYKISVVDERGEFGNEYMGINTDVLSFYPKATGIEISVRTLSPEIVVCDELGNAQEVEAVLEGLNSGVNFIMTIHCKNLSELKRKNQFRILMNYSQIDFCVFLKNKSEIVSIVSGKELRDEIDSINSDFGGVDYERVVCCAQTEQKSCFT